jgi:hypothetical protein
MRRFQHCTITQGPKTGIWVKTEVLFDLILFFTKLSFYSSYAELYFKLTRSKVVLLISGQSFRLKTLKFGKLSSIKLATQSSSIREQPSKYNSSKFLQTLANRRQKLSLNTFFKCDKFNTRKCGSNS